MDLMPGDLWWAAPEPSIGREPAGRRPVLIVSGRSHLELATTLVLAVPLTTTDRGWPNHIQIEGAVSLQRDSFAMTEQVRAISRERLLAPAGRVTADCLQSIRGWILDYLTD